MCKSFQRACLAFSVLFVGSVSAEPAAPTSKQPSISQTATVTAECDHETPLKPGALGSPTNLVQLPNRDPGVSELAALMRKILEGLTAQKRVLETQSQGAKAVALPPLLDFSRISCAWPTDHSTRTALFHAHAIATNKTLENHSKNQTRRSYTQVVDSCLACHQHYCRGPVSAIKGLYLQTLSGPGNGQSSDETCE